MLEHQHCCFTVSYLSSLDISQFTSRPSIINHGSLSVCLPGCGKCHQPGCLLCYIWSQL